MGGPLPLFAPPADVSIWELGKREHWKKLSALIKALTMDVFFVGDSKSDLFLQGVKRMLDSSVDEFTQGLLHHLLWQFEDGEDGIQLFKDLVSIGLEVDCRDHRLRTPVHYCSMRNWVKSCEILLELRVNPTSKDEDSLSQLELAEKNRHEDVAHLLREHAKSGYYQPSLAVLAYQGSFVSVLNLVRRNMISNSEAVQKHLGKNAADWAHHHQKQDIVKELLFRLPVLQITGIPTSITPNGSVGLPTDGTSTRSSKEEPGASSRFDVLENCVKQLQEGLSLCMEKIDKKSEEVAEDKREDQRALRRIERKVEVVTILTKQVDDLEEQLVLAKRELQKKVNKIEDKLGLSARE